MPVDAAGRGTRNLNLVEFLLDPARAAGGELGAGDEVERERKILLPTLAVAMGKSSRQVALGVERG